MFNDNLGFNPFDKAHSPHAKTYTKHREKFLNSFGIKHIFCYNGNPRKKISSMNHTNKLLEATNANVSKNSDVYFYVNGGRKLYAINNFTCCFCDMDAGRDSQGKYFKPSIVMEKKKQFLKKINEFPVQPSWVVDTRNGYQCYWIFDNQSIKMIGKNKTFWNGLQKKLVNYFGGDPRAIKANQIYRVPYTWWRKVWENKQSYFSSVLPGSTGKTVNVADLKSALTGQPANLVIQPEKCSDEWYKSYAQAYKQSDETGVPVSPDVASEILNDMRNAHNFKKSYGVMDQAKYLLNNIMNCGQKNSQVSTNYNTNDNDVDIIDVSNLGVIPNSISESSCDSCCEGSCHDAQDSAGDEVLNPNYEQTKLLKTVVEFLNQVSTPLYFSNNRFLSSAAKELANKLSDHFCIG
jgi:hypothetical protein